MRLDAHVHTDATRDRVRGRWAHTVPAACTSPEQVCELARSRGMDLVTVTDRDAIDGARRIAGEAGVIVGCEVTTAFPEDGVQVRLNVFGLDATSHREIQRLRHDVRRLLPFLRAQGLFTSLNHVARPVVGPMSAVHLMALLPWVDGLETRNGALTAAQNRVAESLALATGKAALGGSDAHTARGIGRTWTEVPGASSAAEFFDGLRQGRGHVGGAHGRRATVAADLVRLSGRRPLTLGRALWRLLRDERHDTDLLFDLLSRPALARALMADAA